VKLELLCKIYRWKSDCFVFKKPFLTNLSISMPAVLWTQNTVLSSVLVSLYTIYCTNTCQYTNTLQSLRGTTNCCSCVDDDQLHADTITTPHKLRRTPHHCQTYNYNQHAHWKLWQTLELTWTHGTVPEVTNWRPSPVADLCAHSHYVESSTTDKHTTTINTHIGSCDRLWSSPEHMELCPKWPTGATSPVADSCAHCHSAWAPPSPTPLTSIQLQSTRTL